MKTTSDIIGKYLSGNCSPEEVLFVEEQLTSSEAFKSEYDSLSQIWGLTNKLDYDSSPIEESWQLFKANVKAPTRGIGFDWLKKAASILLLAAFSVIIFNVTNAGDSYTATAQVEQTTLNDGSQIVLNSHSTLTLTKGFGTKNRDLSLEGEANFQVTQSEQPFVLDLNGGSLTVTGTQFTVFNPAASDYVSIDLFEGSVDLAFGSLTKSVEAGHHVEWNGENLFIAKLNETEARDWTSANEIYCNNTSLKHIMLQMQQHYDVSFKLPKRSLKERYTVSLPKENLESCIALIADITDLPLVLEGQTIGLR